MTFSGAERTQRWRDRKNGVLTPFKRHPKEETPQLRYWYKTKYGITIEEYKKMLKKQNGKCAICGEESKGGRLAVDHNHSTNKVRSLLCYHCNWGIGHFKENLDLLEKAIEYLKHHT